MKRGYATTTKSARHLPRPFFYRLLVCTSFILDSDVTANTILELEPQF